MPLSNQTAYQLVSDVASPNDDEGLKQPRAILLLWFLRNVLGVDDLLAYEFICDGYDDHGIDALWLEGDQATEKETLVVLQSKYPETLKNVGVNDLKQFVGSAEGLATADGVRGLLNQKVEPALKHLLEEFDVVKKLEAGHLAVRLIFVTAGVLTKEAQQYESTINKKHKRNYLSSYDLPQLAPIIEAFKTPTTVKAIVNVACPKDQRFVTTSTSARVMVCSVKAKDVVAWPGIKDRTLFDLNVRRELKRNAVRNALDLAISKTNDHVNFMAFHNGLTIVCEKIDETPADHFTVTNMSVVNGAQSTVAFEANAGLLTDALKIVAKFVEVPPEKQLAREVAIRSNTQNPVTPRNLRARDGVQLRLAAEFKNEFKKYTFETRPDSSNPPGNTVIHNDIAAQLLCAVYNEAPWVAVHKLRLFDSETYPSVFNENVSASHVVMVDAIARAVQAQREKFPPDYLQSWQLTKLVGVYLVGQLLRTSAEYEKILSDPKVHVGKKDTTKTLELLARFAAAAMSTRYDQKKQKKEFDNFKVEFNRESSLRDLAAAARSQFITYKTIEYE